MTFRYIFIENKSSKSTFYIKISPSVLSFRSEPPYINPLPLPPFLGSHRTELILISTALRPGCEYHRLPADWVWIAGI